MFLQTVMLIAREKGLHSCAQEAWAMWHSTVKQHLVVDNNLMLFAEWVSGMLMRIILLTHGEPSVKQSTILLHFMALKSDVIK